MAAIDRVGSFRGKVVDRGIGESSGGFPQAILQLEAAEMWDVDNGVWVPWEYEEIETIAYLILFGKSGKPTLSARQLMKSLGWDGTAFLDIQESDTLNGQIQWRMEENTYEGNTTIRCQWIDHYDAVPGKKVQKLDKADILRLEAKFAAGKQVLSGGPKPKAAPPKAAPKATPKADPAPTAETADTQEPVELVGPPRAAPETGSTTIVAPVFEAPAAPDPPKTEKPKRKARATKPIDMQKAWEQCHAAGKEAGKTDVEVSQMWTKLTVAAGGNEAVGDDWSGIKDAFIAAL